MPTTFALTDRNASRYLADRGLITPAEADAAATRNLGGGVSNIVVRVDMPGRSGGLVLKQSLSQLRVAQEWLADRERIYHETASLQYLDEVLPASALPKVIHEDRANYLFVMTAAPDAGVNWKEALLAGRVDLDVAARVGALLGRIHQHSRVTDAGAPAALRPLADQRCFVQLRIDPYHRATAAVHPELADAIEIEAQRMLDRRRTLVHGDYSPKNVIVTGSGAAAEVFLLDFEVAHLGNPVFDLAFMLNHLTLKAIHQPHLAREYNAAARAFWLAYLDTAVSSAGPVDELERVTVRQLGALLLARIDGKSPAEYLTDARRQQQARNLAQAILSGAMVDLQQLHATLARAAW